VNAVYEIWRRRTLFKVHAEDWSALETAVELHERPPMIGSHFVKILVAAGYSNSEIRLAAATMTSYVD
jgi:hypothetical protein